MAGKFVGLVFLFVELAQCEFQSVLIGIKGYDFVVIAADATFRRGLVAMDDEHDKILQMEDGRQLLAAVGDTGEIDQFCQSIKYSVALHRLRTSRRPKPIEICHFIRRQIVSFRRDQKVIPNLKLLFGAFFNGATSLIWLDETGALLNLPFAAHGMGSALVIGHLDQVYKSDLTKEEAIILMQHCLTLLHERYAPSTSAGFFIKIIDSDGCNITRWRTTPGTKKHTSSLQISSTRAPPMGMRLVRYPPPVKCSSLQGR